MINLYNLEHCLDVCQPSILDDARREFLEDSGAIIFHHVVENTPRRSGNLVDSVGIASYETYVEVATDVSYAPYIETGERNDPRDKVRVYRKLGAARMFARAYESYQGTLPGLASTFMRRIAQAWGR